MLCDQSYSVDEMVRQMKAAGFARVDIYPAWDGLQLNDGLEWIVYVAHKAGADEGQTAESGL
jgi:hypothetical protein